MTGNIWACLGSRAHEPRYSVGCDDPGAPNHVPVGAHLCVHPSLPRVMLSKAKHPFSPSFFRRQGPGDGFFGLRPQNDALAGAVRVMGGQKAKAVPRRFIGRSCPIHRKFTPPFLVFFCVVCYI